MTSHVLGRPLRKLMGSVFTLMLAAALASCAHNGGNEAPNGYHCGTSRNNQNCSAQTVLGEHITGVRASINVADKMTSGNGFISNEIWLNNYEKRKGWIEVGYKESAHRGRQYFWGVLFPEDAIFEEYEIGSVPQSELGKPVEFDIHQIDKDTFEISVHGISTHFTTTVKVHLWQTKQGGFAALGQQLAGDHGAVATRVNFSEIQLYGADGNRRYGLESDLLKDRPDTISKPPYGAWLKAPGLNNRGGVFSTQCCAE